MIDQLALMKAVRPLVIISSVGIITTASMAGMTLGSFAKVVGEVCFDACCAFDGPCARPRRRRAVAAGASAVVCIAGAGLARLAIQVAHPITVSSSLYDMEIGEDVWISARQAVQMLHPSVVSSEFYELAKVTCLTSKVMFIVGMAVGVAPR